MHGNCFPPSKFYKLCVKNMETPKFKSKPVMTHDKPNAKLKGIDKE